MLTGAMDNLAGKELVVDDAMQNKAAEHMSFGVEMG